MSSNKEKAKENLLALMPFLYESIEQVDNGAKARLWILQYNKDGSGKIIASFDIGDFIKDLATVIDAPQHTKESGIKAMASLFVKKYFPKGK